MKLKVNDLVQVIAGKDKGKRGKITRIDRKNDKVVVEKINMRKKHIRKSANKPGEIITFEGPIHISNVMIICPETDKPTRIGYQKTKDGKKERISKKSGASLDSKITK